MNMTLARTTYMMDRGQRIADIAVYYPIESLWAELLPEPIPGSNWWATDAITPEAGGIEETFNRVSQQLFAWNREFSYVDSQALEEAQVVDGALVWPNGARRTVLILPEASVVPRTAWQKIEDFWNDGGTVIAIGSLPEHSTTAFPEEERQEILQVMFDGLPNAAGGTAHRLSIDAGSSLKATLDERLESPFSVESESGAVLTSYKRSDLGEILLLLNNSKEPESVRVELQGDDELVVCDPQSGTVRSFTRGQPLELGPYEARILLPAPTS